MGKPAARIGDMHTCPMVTPGTPPVPHVGGPVSGPSVPNVLIGGKPASVMGDMCVCTGPPDTIIMGSTGVLIGGKPAARMGDMTAHGGVVVMGQPNVLIGEIMPGVPPIVILAPGVSGLGNSKSKAANSLRESSKVMERNSKAASKQMATMIEASINGTPFCEKCSGKSTSEKFKAMSKEERQEARRKAIAEKKEQAKQKRKEQMQQAQRETMQSAGSKGSAYVPKCEYL